MHAATCATVPGLTLPRPALLEKIAAGLLQIIVVAADASQNTAGGRRQMEREVQVLGEVNGKVSHIVQVEEIRCSPLPMLLMRKEPGTLSSMLKDASNSIPREIVK